MHFHPFICVSHLVPLCYHVLSRHLCHNVVAVHVRGFKAVLLTPSHRLNSIQSKHVYLAYITLTCLPTEIFVFSHININYIFVIYIYIYSFYHFAMISKRHSFVMCTMYSTCTLSAVSEGCDCRGACRRQRTLYTPQ